MSRDSVYQQLRGHLAYLKLAATAEALPSRLEAARRSDIGHTEFLEGLFRVEVEATEARRCPAGESSCCIESPNAMQDVKMPSWGTGSNHKTSAEPLGRWHLTYPGRDSLTVI